MVSDVFVLVNNRHISTQDIKLYQIVMGFSMEFVRDVQKF